MSDRRPRHEGWRGRLGVQIRQQRKRHGLKNAGELAELAGLSKQAVEHLETAQGNPTLGTIEAVLKAIRSDLDLHIVSSGHDKSIDNHVELDTIPPSSQEREKTEGASMNDDPDPRRDPDARAILGAFESFKRQVKGDERLLGEFVKAVWRDADALLKQIEQTAEPVERRREARGK